GRWPRGRGAGGGAAPPGPRPAARIPPSSTRRSPPCPAGWSEAPGRSPAARAASTPSEAPMANRGKVLVVDDEPTILELFKEYLVDRGLEVITAAGGAEALECLQQDKPAVVLLDMRMPDMDGIETLKRIRAVSVRIPVLMVSASDDLTAAREAIALGAFDYTLKPVDWDYLGRALDKMLSDVAPTIEPGLGVGIEA